MAGQYHGLAPEEVLPPSRHFLGDPSWGVYRYDGRTQILGCECGEPGCWPLVCEIRATETRVVWAAFEQPHRSYPKTTHPPWTYDGFGPFEFDRKQYESALSTVRPEHAR
jgi:hypothetical protein